MANKSANNQEHSSPQLITIEAEHLPSKSFSLQFEPPLYKDYNDARRLYPTNANQVSAQGTPYSVEELLFAKQLRSINNTPVPSTPQDLTDLLKPFLLEDLQFLTEMLISAFMIDNELARSARILADQQKNTDKLVKTIDRKQLPLASHSVTFNTPNQGTKMHVERLHQGPQVNGCTLEEMLTVFCMSSIDGQPVKHSPQIIDLVYDWPIVDFQYLTLLFVNMFTLDEAGLSSAKNLGKQLRQQFGGNNSAIEQKTTTPAA